MPIGETVARSVEYVGKIPTVVSRIGQVKDAHVCGVVIPGNPGAIEFYDLFIEKLYELSGYSLPIIGIAHAGHSPVWHYMEGIHDWSQGNDKTVEDQIKHKELFLTSVIPSVKRVILIGHSVGCYIALKLLEKIHIADRVLQTVLLFPTIERIAETPNGLFWNPVSRYFRWMFSYVAFLLSISPSWVREMAVNWRTSWKGRTVPSKIREHCGIIMSYSLMNNALLMAKHEMDEIKGIDNNLRKVIQKNLQSVTFYYGVSDRWAPLDFYYGMKEMFPNGDVRLCMRGFEHDFVLDGSIGVAEVVWAITGKEVMSLVELTDE